MADITPLRGEGRTIGRITGLYGELLSEFLGVFVLIAFVHAPRPGPKAPGSGSAPSGPYTTSLSRPKPGRQWP